MLLWREPGDKEELRRAPLLLVPIELERKSAGEGFRAKYSGDDVVPQRLPDGVSKTVLSDFNSKTRLKPRNLISTTIFWP